MTVNGLDGSRTGLKSRTAFSHPGYEAEVQLMRTGSGATID